MYVCIGTPELIRLSGDFYLRFSLDYCRYIIAPADAPCSSICTLVYPAAQREFRTLSDAARRFMASFEHVYAIKPSSAVCVEVPLVRILLLRRERNCFSLNEVCIGIYFVWLRI